MKRALSILSVVSLFGMAFAAPSWAAVVRTSRVSVSSSGKQGDSDSPEARISANGRWVAFQSFSDNLVPGDRDHHSDIYAHSLRTGKTKLVSVSTSGKHGNFDSYSPAISGNGHRVVFHSYATNLVPGVNDRSSQIFLRNVRTHKTSLVSVSSSGEQGNDGSFLASISANGRWVAFYSFASNLVPGDTNGSSFPDVFAHNFRTGKTKLVSVSSTGEQGNDRSELPSVSADGHRIAFASYASNLVPGDTNGTEDIFVHNFRTGKTKLVSVSSSGVQGNQDTLHASISASGRRVAFESSADNLVGGDNNGRPDVFIHNFRTGKTKLVSVSSSGVHGGLGSYSPSIFGHRVAFVSNAHNLVPHDINPGFDVFIRNLRTGKTRLVSVSTSGVQANGGSGGPSISANGHRIAFWSAASNLVPHDTNRSIDVFVRGRLRHR